MGLSALLLSYTTVSGQTPPAADELSEQEFLDSRPDQFIPYDDGFHSCFVGFHLGIASRFTLSTRFGRLYGANQAGQLAFSGLAGTDGEGKLYIASLQRRISDLTQILPNEVVTSAVWRPQHPSDLAVILRHGFDFDLYTYRIDTGVLSLVALAVNPAFLRWNNNGENLYYAKSLSPDTPDLEIHRYATTVARDTPATIALLEAASFAAEQLNAAFFGAEASDSRNIDIDFASESNVHIRFETTYQRMIVAGSDGSPALTLANVVPIATLMDGLIFKQWNGGSWDLFAISRTSGAISLLINNAPPPASMVPWPSSFAELLLTRSTLSGDPIFVNTAGKIAKRRLLSAETPETPVMTREDRASPSGMPPIRPLITSPVASISLHGAQAPYGIAFDGANVWITDQATNNVTKLRVSDGTILGTYAVGTSPQGVVFDGANIWVANYLDNTLTKLRAIDGVTLATISLGNSLNPQWLAYDGANIWVTDNFAGKVSKVRASDGFVLGSFATSTPYNSNAFPIGILFDGTNLWIANSSPATVVKLRPVDGTILGTTQIGSGGLCGGASKPPCPIPYGLAFDGNDIWVSDKGSNAVTKLSVVDGSILGNFPAGNGPTGLAFDGANIWVADNSSGTITKIRTSDGATLSTISVGNAPLGIAFDGTNLWVANSVDNTVSEVPAGVANPCLSLQNQVNSGLSDWFMGGVNGATIESAPWFATAAAGWVLMATADMNGDGIPDLIFQNHSTGGVSVWFMTGTGGLTIGSAPIIYTAAPNWNVVAAADMNGDGQPDLILQNAVTNQISIWFMNAGGLSFSSTPVIGASAPGWKVVTTADMNRDGVPDLLLQNQSTNEVAIWFMLPGGQAYSAAPIVASPAVGWTLVAARDLNGDGLPDYIFQNRSGGSVSVWYMTGNQGTTYSSAPVIATAAPGWYLIAAH